MMERREQAGKGAAGGSDSWHRRLASRTSLFFFVGRKAPCGLMATKPRARASANGDVGVVEYHLILKRHFDKHNNFHFLKPYVSEVWKVTPTMVVNGSSLLKDFILAGLRNGVMKPAMCELEVKKIMSSSSPQLAGAACDKDAAAVTDHLKCLFGMLRNLKAEANKAPRKTGAFRRRMNGSDIVVVNALLDELRFDADGRVSQDTRAGRGSAGRYAESPWIARIQMM